MKTLEEEFRGTWCATCFHNLVCLTAEEGVPPSLDGERCFCYDAKKDHEWNSKPLPKATHCIIAIKWADDDIEVTEEDTTFITRETAERVIAWRPLPEPPKEVPHDRTRRTR